MWFGSNVFLRGENYATVLRFIFGLRRLGLVGVGLGCLDGRLSAIGR
jgi:hypothetical protein